MNLPRPLSPGARAGRGKAIPGLLLVLLGLGACVTVNVYFPAAEAERAADKIITRVLGEDGQPAPEATPPPPGQSRPSGDLFAPGAPARTLLAALAPVRSARAQANIDISTPAIEALTASMQRRHARLAPYYDSGAIGFTEDGLVAIRDQGAVPIRERQALVQLVAAENQDRKALYREIARANGHPEWEDEIAATFGRRWVERGRSGWWYRRGGAWRQI